MFVDWLFLIIALIVKWVKRELGCLLAQLVNLGLEMPWFVQSKLAILWVFKDNNGEVQGPSLSLVISFVSELSNMNLLDLTYKTEVLLDSILVYRPHKVADIESTINREIHKVEAMAITLGTIGSLRLILAIVVKDRLFP